MLNFRECIYLKIYFNFNNGNFPVSYVVSLPEVTGSPWRDMINLEVGCHRRCTEGVGGSCWKFEKMVVLEKVTVISLENYSTFGGI